jgi:hypothetical protein
MSFKKKYIKLARSLVVVLLIFCSPKNDENIYEIILVTSIKPEILDNNMILSPNKIQIIYENKYLEYESGFIKIPNREVKIIMRDDEQGSIEKILINKILHLLKIKNYKPEDLSKISITVEIKEFKLIKNPTYRFDDMPVNERFIVYWKWWYVSYLVKTLFRAEYTIKINGEAIEGQYLGNSKYIKTYLVPEISKTAILYLIHVNYEIIFLIQGLIPYFLTDAMSQDDAATKSMTLVINDFIKELDSKVPNASELNKLRIKENAK